MLLRRLIPFAAVMACASAARAQAPDRVAEPVNVSLLVGLRPVHPFSAKQSYASPLVAYGYHDIRVFFDLNAAASYRVIRWLDLGGRMTWLYSNGGSRGADGAVLQVNALEVMGFVRPWLRIDHDRTGAGIELAGGVQGGFITLRGEVVARASYVIAPTLVAFMATTRVHPTLRFGPVFSRLKSVLGGADIATSGLSISLGANLNL